jgi:hypothetical protein
MKGIAAAIASALPGGAPWLSETSAAPWPGEMAEPASPEYPAETPVDARDLAELLKRHDEVRAAEQQGFNDRLASLLNTRHELPANDRRRLSALLAELLDHRDEVVAGEHPDVDPIADQSVDVTAAEPAPEAAAEPVPAPDEVPASLIVSFDHAVDGIVKSVNEHFAANKKASIVPGQDVDGQSSG